VNYQERVIAITQEAVDALFRTARAMPADKIEWRPLDEGRSALHQLQECAQAPSWATMILQPRAMPPLGPDDFARFRAQRSEWTTVDECERVCRENLEKFNAAVRNLTEDELEIKVILPFGGGTEWTLEQVLRLPYWNTVYHTGQINYIQTLYGDREMH
jgi:hypothetical protein